MTRRTFIATLAAVAAATLALDSSALRAQEAPMGDGGTVRLLYSPSGTQSFPPFAIEKYALDEKYGFELELIPTGYTSATINAMMAGEGDVAILDWVNVARLRANGIEMIGIAPFLAYVNTIIVPADSPAASVADLKGQRIGALNVNSFDWIMTLAAAKEAGVDLTEGSQIIDGAPALMRGMLEQGQLDATIMYNSLTPDTIIGGDFKVMATIRDLALGMGLPDVPFISYVATEEWVEGNEANAAAFVAAYREAVEILMTDDEVWVERAVGEMDMDPKAAELLRDLVRKDLLTHYTEDDNGTYQATFDLLFPIAGEEVFGFAEMPETVVSLRFNE